MADNRLRCEEFQTRLLEASEQQVKLLAILVRLLSTQPPLPKGVNEPDMGTTGSDNG